jgi:deazaflavin-dependent oxidoreductase (nitroreductase family)
MSAIHPDPSLAASAPGDKPATPHRSLGWKLTHSTNSLMVHFAGTRVFPLWAIIEHKGRKSGRTFKTPIVARRTDDGFYIPMPFGPETDWTRNVIAAGGAAIRWKGRRYELTNPEIVDPEAARAAFAGWQSAAFKPVGIEHFLRLRDSH